MGSANSTCGGAAWACGSVGCWVAAAGWWVVEGSGCDRVNITVTRTEMAMIAMAPRLSQKMESEDFLRAGVLSYRTLEG
jgi:hypothetical protein